MVMHMRTLGKTGLSVSNLGFGCMRLPIRNGNTEDIDIPLATAMVRKAIDAGVNYVDTAYVYHGANFPSPGMSEPFLARALADGYREKVALATKLPLWIVESRSDMNRLLDEQLKRLGTGHIDVYLAHNVVAPIWPKMRDLGIRAFLDEARKDGRIRHAAFSIHDQYPLFAQVLGEYDWDATQLQYNYLDVDYQVGQRGVELAASKNVGVIIMEPLRGGFLVNHIPADLQAELKAKRPDWSFADWAFRWLWNQPQVEVVLSGMTAMAQVEENLRIAADAKVGGMGADDIAALDKIRRRFADRLEVNCTGCDYCQPCPQGVAIGKIFSMYNEYGMADVEDIRWRARNFYGAALKPEERADRCVGCHVCESRCPQHIPIADLMPKAAERLG